LELEKGSATADRVSSMLRSAHTLKGAARVVKQPATAELAHSIEEVLSPFRSDAGAVPQASVQEALQLLERIGGELAALDGQPSKPQQQKQQSGGDAKNRSAVSEPLDSIRVDVEELEILRSSLSEVGAGLAAIGSEAAATLGNARRQASLLVQQLQSQLAGLEAPAAARIRTLAEQLR